MYPMIPGSCSGTSCASGYGVLKGEKPIGGGRALWSRTMVMIRKPWLAPTSFARLAEGYA